MTTQETLTGRDIGQAERAMRALLDRLLDVGGMTFEEWVALNLLVGSPGASGNLDTLTRRIAGSQRIGLDTAREAFARLERSGLAAARGGEEVALTSAGEARFHHIKGEVDRTMERLYLGLSPAELATAHRVLVTIAEHASRELASA